MKQKAILVIALLALVSLMIIPASAETITGTLGSPGIYNTTNYIAPITGGSSDYTNATYLKIISVQYVTPLVGMILFDQGVEASARIHWGISNPDTPGEATNFIGRIGTTQVVTGTIGYQRYWDNSYPTPIEQKGYQYVLFNNWNVSGFTGTQYLNMSYDHAALHYMHYEGYSTYTPSYNGITNFRLGTTLPDGNFDAGGVYQWIKYDLFNHVYSVTSPDALGISGYVQKEGYSSKITIVNAGTNVPITSEYSVSASDFNFTVLQQPIYISAYSSLGTWYNSSILFAAAVPTVTPTPGPTAPPGYVRNNLFVWDQNDAQIIGADVDVLDVEAGTWTNTSADADGRITIDTLPYHTVNVYAHYPTPNIYLPNEILGLETGYYGGHNWVLVLYPYVITPPGFVTLYINTRNYDTKAVLTGVNLQIKNLVTGATTGESTGSTDSVSTVVTNATNYQITGSKSGYLSKTIVINSGEASSKTVVVELSRATVTPTITVTGSQTIDPRNDTKKATDAFSKWMNILGDITDIAIGVVIIWLMWITVYMITGGKIIDKIMKRGRK